MKGASRGVGKATFVVCLLLEVNFARAEVAQVRDSKMTVLGFVNKLASLVKIGPMEVESLLGKQLSPVPQMSGAYTAHDIPFEDATIELLDYRGSKLLVIFLKREGCIARTKILADYGPLRITQVPSGHSPDERTYYTRPEKWGELSFGFPANSFECLRSIVFTMK
jgi:hypothetical protein